MHAERYEVPAGHAARHRRTQGARRPRRRRRHDHRAHARIVGARAARPRGDTRIFITPGFAFAHVDLLVTNFHLPKSTLMMLVSAFAGYEHVMALYAPCDRASATASSATATRCCSPRNTH